MTCVHCNEEIYDGDERWAFEEPYCNYCFQEHFTYCSRCDAVIRRDDDNVQVLSGDYYCEGCYDEENDADCPDNPNVYPEDRDFIVTLARNSLKGPVKFKTMINVNEKDYILPIIRKMVGAVDNGIYLYGLVDRPEYSIVISEDMYQDFHDFMAAHKIIPPVTRTEEGTYRRLGVSYMLRKNRRLMIVELIKHLCNEKEEVCAE